MKCSYCDNEISEGDKFCRECGAPNNNKLKKVEEKTIEKVEKKKEEVKEQIKTESKIVSPSKGQAIASMVIGIVSFIFGFILIPLPIVGLILGLTYKGKCGEKTAGIILNSIVLGLSLLLWSIVLIGIAVFRNSESISDLPNYNHSVEVEDNIIEDNIFDSDFFNESYRRYNR